MSVDRRLTTFCGRITRMPGVVVLTRFVQREPGPMSELQYALDDWISDCKNAGRAAHTTGWPGQC
jgi:hypothetical protein